MSASGPAPQSHFTTDRMSSAPAADPPNSCSSPSLESVDQSFCSLAFIALSKGFLWFLLGGLLLLLASVKLHGPGMLAGHDWLTYGRVQPAGWAVLVYGFAGQVGAVVGLWLVARAARQRLQAPLLALAGIGLWNIGVLVGAVGILAGYSTGREWMEMPAGALAILVIAAGVLGTVGWMTYAARVESDAYPSAWFVLLAFLSFVWLGTVALMMLGGESTRGVVQVLVQRWFANGVGRLWLGGLTVAVLFHALPLAAGRPLASRGLATVAFWSLACFAPWAITTHGEPFPRWVISAGVAGQFLSGIGLLALAMNWWSTVEGRVNQALNSLRGRVLVASALTYLGGGAFKLFLALSGPSQLFAMTWVQQGLDWAAVGSAALVIVALVPEFFARATGRELAPGLVAGGTWLTLVGVVVVTLSLTLSGILQGLKLGAGTVPFTEALASSMHLVRLSTLGLMAILAGQVTFGLAIAGAWKSRFIEGVAVVRGWALPSGSKTVGVRS